MKSIISTIVLACHAQALKMGVKEPYDAGTTGRAVTEEVNSNGDVIVMDNVIVDESQAGLDAETRPLCSTGGTFTRQDFQGPSPGCCRVYEADEYFGLHYDFCLYNVLQNEKYWQLDITGWHNEINSWKCADDVSIKICAHINDTRQLQVGDCLENAPNVQTGCGANPTVGTLVGNAVNEHDSLWVRRLNPNCPPDEPCVAGMVYDLPDCGGGGFMVTNEFPIDEYPNETLEFRSFMGSYNKYDYTTHYMLAGGDA